MRLDRIPGKKTAAVIGKIFNGMAKESKYTLIPNGDFLHDGTNDPCVTNGSFGVYYFTIKELPGFNFAIWMLNIERFASERYYWTYCVFGAHEHDWDKFKPSRIQCKISNRIMLDEELNIMFEESVVFSADELFDYIKKEPYLARYRELTDTNCNLEYVSRWKAKKYVQKYDRDNARRERREKAIANRLIKRCSRDLMNIEGVERICLIESNTSSPRFHFMISGSLGDDIVSGASYGMFDLDKSQEYNSNYAIDDCISYVDPESFDKKVEQIRANKFFYGTVTIIK